MRKARKQQFWTAEMKTRPLDGGFLAGELFDGRKSQGFEDGDRFFDFLLNIEGVCFIHQLDDHLRVIYGWCLDNKIEIVTTPILAGERKIIEWKIRNVVFRDSFILTQESIENLTESFGLKVDLGFGERQKLKKSARVQFLRQRTIALHKILEKFYDFLGWQYFNKKTIASIAMAKFKEIDGGSFMKIAEHLIYSQDDKFLRKAFFSTYSHVFVDEIKGGGGRILKIDMNSFYGFIMKNNLFPWGRLKRIEDERKIAEHLKTDLGVIEAIATIPKLEVGFLPARRGGSIDYPCSGKIRGSWTSTEILFAQEIGYKFKFKRAIFWEFKNYLFRKYVSKIGKIKEGSRGAKKIIAKFLLVSLHGKFAQTREISTYQKTKRRASGSLYFDEGLTMIEKKRYVWADFSHPEIAVFTLAYARLWMYKFCQEIGRNNVFAIMNDSLIIKDSLTRKFKDRWFDKNQIGKFKIEAEIEEAIFLGQGVYAIRDTSGGEIIRTQGIPKNTSRLSTFGDFERAKRVGVDKVIRGE